MKELIAYALLHFLQFLNPVMFAAGIQSQATFGNNECLLAVSNYRKEQEYVFDAESPLCNLSLSVGILSGIFAITLFTLKIVTTLRKIDLPQNVPLYSSIFMTVWWIILFISVAMASAGINSTCADMEKAGSDCGVVYNNSGFINEESKSVEYKSFGTVKFAIGAGWVSVVLFTFFPLHLFFLVRRMRGTPGATPRFQPKQ